MTVLPPGFMGRLRRLRRLRRLWLRVPQELTDRWTQLAGAAFVLISLSLIGSGLLRSLTIDRPRLGPALVVAVALLAVGSQLGQRLRLLGSKAAPPMTPRQEDLIELTSAGALVAATYTLLQAMGGAHSPLHPLSYALVAFLCSHQRAGLCLPLCGLVLCGEVLLFLGDGVLAAEFGRLLCHGLFIILFASLHLLFFQGEMLRQRRDHQLQVGRELTRLRDEAEGYRLLSAEQAEDHSPGTSSGGEPATRLGPPAGRDRGRTSGSMYPGSMHAGAGETARSSRAEEQAILAQAAVVVIQKSQHSTVELIKKALHLHSCALLWLDAGGEVLKVKELCTDSRGLIRTQVPADAGALGTIVKSQRPLNLTGPKPQHLAYYAGPGEGGEIGSFLGVPILENDRLRGVLCADRRLQRPAPDRSGPGAPVPFTEEDVALLNKAGEQLLRSLQSERLFAAVERSKYEQERLYQASEKLNRALTPEQVHGTAFFAVREICDFDFAAITSYDKQTRRHLVVAVEAEGPGQADQPDQPSQPGQPDLKESLLGLTFKDNSGLVAMVVKNRHFLPPEGVLRDREAPIFDEKVRLKGMESLLLLPLICGGEAVGALVFGNRRKGVFTKDKRDMLGVIANQVAVSLENARMYQAMEAMATTDGLTGLTNRRAYQERFGEMLQRAERQGKSLTLLLSDIDHFKRVNDTYGHPVGDVVLKRVAQVVQSCVRKIDMAARYGGEEFAVVLEMTDRQGGRQLAERVRQEVQRLWFHSDKGPFQCTLSLGMATFPLDGGDMKTLTEHADQALYHAKHSGRNQAVAYEDLREHRAAG